MKKTILVILFVTAILLTGCTASPATDLADEAIATFQVIEEVEAEASVELATDQPSLAGKLKTIGFQQVSGQYTRNVTQDDIVLTELFALEKTNFIRIAQGDMEQEVFAYNYKSDDFTYLYYFDGDLMTKTKFNVDTGAVLEDESGFADLLTSDATELKTYFYDLLAESGLSPDDLIES